MLNEIHNSLIFFTIVSDVELLVQVSLRTIRTCYLNLH